jgi:hypothetical protein
MDKIIPESPEARKELMQSLLVNPEVYVYLGLLLFGTAAVGWFLIGLGMLLALIPLVGLVGYWILEK